MPFVNGKYVPIGGWDSIDQARTEKQGQSLMNAYPTMVADEPTYVTNPNYPSAFNLYDNMMNYLQQTAPPPQTPQVMDNTVTGATFGLPQQIPAMPQLTFSDPAAGMGMMPQYKPNLMDNTVTGATFGQQSQPMMPQFQFDPSTIPNSPTPVPTQTLGDYIFKENPVARVLNRPWAVAAADDSFGMAPQVPSSGYKWVDKTTDFLGHMIAPFIPVGGGLPTGVPSSVLGGTSQAIGNLAATKAGQAIEGAIGQGAANVASKIPFLSPDLVSKMATSGARGAASGATYGAVSPFAFGVQQQDADGAVTWKPGGIEDVPKSMLDSALMFAGGDAAIPLLGAGLKKLQGPFFDTVLKALNMYEGVRRGQTTVIDPETSSARASQPRNVLDAEIVNPEDMKYALPDTNSIQKLVFDNMPESMKADYDEAMKFARDQGIPEAEAHQTILDTLAQTMEGQQMIVDATHQAKISQDTVNLAKAPAQVDAATSTTPQAETTNQIDPELFNQAKQLVLLDQGTPSISSLQRYLRLGYTDAAKIIDELERQGIITPYDGKNPRQVIPQDQGSAEPQWLQDVNNVQGLRSVYFGRNPKSLEDAVAMAKSRLAQYDDRPNYQASKAELQAFVDKYDPDNNIPAFSVQGQPQAETTPTLSSDEAQAQYKKMKEDLATRGGTWTTGTKVDRLQQMKDFAEQNNIPFHERHQEYLDNFTAQLEAEKKSKQPALAPQAPEKPVDDGTVHHVYGGKAKLDGNIATITGVDGRSFSLDVSNFPKGVSEYGDSFTQEQRKALNDAAKQSGMPDNPKAFGDYVDGSMVRAAEKLLLDKVKDGTDSQQAATPTAAPVENPKVGDQVRLKGLGDQTFTLTKDMGRGLFSVKSEKGGELQNVHTSRMVQPPANPAPVTEPVAKAKYKAGDYVALKDEIIPQLGSAETHPNIYYVDSIRNDGEHVIVRPIKYKDSTKGTGSFISTSDIAGTVPDPSNVGAKQEVKSDSERKVAPKDLQDFTLDELKKMGYRTFKDGTGSDAPMRYHDPIIGKTQGGVTGVGIKVADKFFHEQQLEKAIDNRGTYNKEALKDYPKLREKVKFMEEAEKNVSLKGDTVTIKYEGKSHTYNYDELTESSKWAEFRAKMGKVFGAEDYDRTRAYYKTIKHLRETEELHAAADMVAKFAREHGLVQDILDTFDAEEKSRTWDGTLALDLQMVELLRENRDIPEGTQTFANKEKIENSWRVQDRFDSRHYKWESDAQREAYRFFMKYYGLKAYNDGSAMKAFNADELHGRGFYESALPGGIEKRNAVDEFMFAQDKKDREKSKVENLAEAKAMTDGKAKEYTAQRLSSQGIREAILQGGNLDEARKEFIRNFANSGYAHGAISFMARGKKGTIELADGRKLDVTPNELFDRLVQMVKSGNENVEPVKIPTKEELVKEAVELRVPAWGTKQQVQQRINKAKLARSAVDGKSAEDLHKLSVAELEAIMLNADMLPTEGNQARNKDTHIARLLAWRDGTPTSDVTHVSTLKFGEDHILSDIRSGKYKTPEEFRTAMEASGLEKYFQPDHWDDSVLQPLWDRHFLKPGDKGINEDGNRVTVIKINPDENSALVKNVDHKDEPTGEEYTTRLYDLQKTTENVNGAKTAPVVSSTVKQPRGVGGFKAGDTVRLKGSQKEEIYLNAVLEDGKYTGVGPRGIHYLVSYETVAEVLKRAPEFNVGDTISFDDPFAKSGKIGTDGKPSPKPQIEATIKGFSKDSITVDFIRNDKKVPHLVDVNRAKLVVPQAENNAKPVYTHTQPPGISEEAYNQLQPGDKVTFGYPASATPKGGERWQVYTGEIVDSIEYPEVRGSKYPAQYVRYTHLSKGETTEQLLYDEVISVELAKTATKKYDSKQWQQESQANLAGYEVGDTVYEKANNHIVPAKILEISGMDKESPEGKVKLDYGRNTGWTSGMHIVPKNELSMHTPDHNLPSFLENDKVTYTKNGEQHTGTVRYDVRPGQDKVSIVPDDAANNFESFTANVNNVKLANNKADAIRQDQEEIQQQIDFINGEIQGRIDNMKQFLQEAGNIGTQESLRKKIMMRGGIAPYTGKDLAEEYKSIPLGLRNSKGLPLDEMADELSMTERDLIDALSGKPIKMDYDQQALRNLRNDDDFNELVKTRDLLQEGFNENQEKLSAVGAVKRHIDAANGDYEKAYQSAQNEIDALENEIAAKHGEKAVLYPPAEYEQRVTDLYDVRDEIGRMWDEQQIQTALKDMPKDGPATKDMMEKALKEIQRDFHWSKLNKIEIKDRQISEMVRGMYTSLSHDLALSGDLPDPLAGDLGAAIDVAKSWPNTHYGMNPTPLLRQVRDMGRSLFGESAAVDDVFKGVPFAERKTVEAEAPKAISNGNRVQVDDATKRVIIHFKEKPSAEIREAMKEQQMRWHGKEEYWYGHNTPERLEFANRIIRQSVELSDEQKAEIVDRDKRMNRGEFETDWMPQGYYIDENGSVLVRRSKHEGTMTDWFRFNRDGTFSPGPKYKQVDESKAIRINTDRIIAEANKPVEAAAKPPVQHSPTGTVHVRKDKGGFSVVDRDGTVLHTYSGRNGRERAEFTARQKMLEGKYVPSLGGEDYVKSVNINGYDLSYTVIDTKTNQVRNHGTTLKPKEAYDKPRKNPNFVPPVEAEATKAPTLLERRDIRKEYDERRGAIRELVNDKARMDLINQVSDGRAYLPMLKDVYDYFEHDHGDLDHVKQGDIAKALETVQEVEAAAKPEAPVQQIADQLKELLRKGEEIQSSDLYRIADSVYKGSQAEGRYTPKDAYDAMELAVNQYLLQQKYHDLTIRDTATVKENVAYLANMTKLLPTQTKRTEDMEKFQQFSTPPAIAYVANWLADIGKNDTVLEPSAGIGGIAVFAKANGAKVIVNELDPRRLEIIKNMPFDRYFKEDGEQLNNILPTDVKPTAVIMNPPFSTSATRGVTDTTNSFKHVEQALKRLEDGGRLVAVLGQGRDGINSMQFNMWLRKLKETYTVRASLGIDGKNYVKYGTSFNVQYLVIDKTGPTTDATLIDHVSTLEQAIDKLEAIANDKQATAPSNQSSESTAVEPNGGNSSGKTPSTGGTGGGGGRPSSSGSTGGNRNPSSGNDLGDGGGTPESTGDTGKELDSGKNDEGTNDLGGRGQSDSSGDVQNDSEENADSGSGKLDSEKSGSRNNSKLKKELTDSVFEDYVPQKLKIKGAQKHPGTLAESAAMSAVEPPDVTYKPKLPENIIKDGALSDAQLEAITYAGQAHSQMLPDEKTRRGFFIGDGTGVGKGREIAGIILDNFMQGRKKAVWVTMNDDLLPSSRRDWNALGGNTKDVFEAPAMGKPISQKEGILFTKYGTIGRGITENADGSLKAKDAVKGSRIDQLVNWFGKDFDGVIVFDEAHNMANSIGMKGSRGNKGPSGVGLAGVDIQKRLPNARIVYVSATGATEVSNLAYAERLGLWGPGTAFANKYDFIGKISDGGIAAMELVARDMKAMGMYIARNLSYDGVQYDKLQHSLTPAQRDVYEALAGSWQIVLQNIDEALKAVGIINDKGKTMDGNLKGQAIGQFWSAQQRFFNSVLTSMQMPTVLKDVEKELAAGKAVVMQLVNTNEASQEREINKMQEEEGSLEDVDMTPREILLKFLDKSFPIHQYEEYVEPGDEKEKVRLRLVRDSNGDPVINREAQAMKDDLMAKVSTLKVPEGVIDIVLNHFGSDNVAEITGRKRRIVEKMNEETGRVERVLENRGGTAGEAEEGAFMSGNKNILIFSDAGGTGRSYHADLTKKNQKQRVHYVVQPGWQATKAVQGFGRTHRTNQASAPTYKLVTTDLKGQMRFVSSIARRLDQLGALTKGQRQTGSQGFFSASDNLEGQIAKDSLEIFYKALARNQIPGLNRDEILTKMGLKDKLLDENNNLMDAPEIREITKFLNRILVLEPDLQNKVFEEFQYFVERLTEDAIKKGTLDTGLENLQSDYAKVMDEAEIRKDQTGGTTKYYELELGHKSLPVELKTLMKQAGEGFDGVYVNEHSKAVKALFDRGTSTLKNGDVVTRYSMFGQERMDWRTINAKELADSKWTKVDNADEAQRMWDEELGKLPEYRTEKVHMISGTLLPVWDRLPNSRARVVRVATETHGILLGRLIASNAVDQTLRKMGAEARGKGLDLNSLAENIIQNDHEAIFANGWRLSKKRISGQSRIELTNGSGPELYNHGGNLRNAGVFSEKIGYTYRYFLPIGDRANEVLQRINQLYPISEIVEPGDSANVQTMFPLKNATPAGQPNTAAGPAVQGNVAPVKRTEILKFISQKFNVPIGTAKYKNRAAGIYNTLTNEMRTKEFADFVAIAHELGHRLDNLFQFSDRTRFENELIALTQNLVLPKRITKKEIRAEGVAEFMRYYLHDPQTAQQIAPSFYQHFEDALEQRGQLENIQQLRDMVDRWYTQSATDRVRGATDIGRNRDKKPVLESAVNMKNKVNDLLFEELGGIERGLLKMLGEDVKTLPDNKNPYMLAWQNRGTAKRIEAFLEAGVWDDNLKKVGESLSSILKSAPDLDTFRDYIMALRAIELHDQGKFRTPISETDAEQIKDEVENGSDAQKYMDARDNLYKYQDLVLDELVRAGMVSQSKVVQWRQDHKFYIPFYRVMEDMGERSAEQGGSGNIRGMQYANLQNPIFAMKAEGSARNIIDPFESIIKNTYLFITLANQNKVGRALADIADNTEDSAHIMAKVSTPAKATSFDLNSIADTLEEAGFDLSDPNLNLDAIATVFEQTFHPNKASRVLNVWRNGQVQQYQVRDNDMYNALIHMNPQVLNFWVKLGSIPNNILKAGITLSPTFIPKNPQRGLPTLLMQSDSFTTPLDYAQLPVMLVKNIFSVMKHDDEYWKWASSGGATSTLMSISNDYLKKSTNEILHKDWKKELALNVGTMGLRPAIQILRKASELGDEPFRLAEHQMAWKKTGNATTAAVRSRDVDLDFNKFGSSMRVPNALNSFFNIAFGGPNRVYRTFKKDFWRTMMRGSLFLTVPALVVLAANWDNEDYWELPSWRRDLFLNIPRSMLGPLGAALPADWKFMTIPIPFEYGLIFKTMPERLIAGYAGKPGQPVHKQVSEFMANVKSVLAPSVVPQFLIPYLQWLTNTNLQTGTPIVPQRLSAKPEDQQIGRNTSEVSKMLGKTFGVSPLKIDQLINDTTSSMGKLVTGVVDKGLAATGAVNPPSKPSGERGIITKSLSTNITDSQSQSISDFYDKFNQSEDDFKKTGKKITPLPLERMRQTELKLAAMRAMLDNVYQSMNLTPDQKQTMVDRINMGMVDSARQMLSKPPIDQANLTRANAEARIFMMQREYISPLKIIDSLGKRK